MTDPLTLALPMIQTLATMGASGSLELTSATGLHISASASYTPTVSYTHLTLPTILLV